MGEALLFLVGVVALFVWLSSKGNNRGYGDDSDRKGCRDCIACVRPLIQRMFINVTWGLVRGPFVAFISTCPACGHVNSKHGKRADGSFLD